MNELDMNALLAALQLGETQDWEFKSAKGGFPRNFWETYSAMANTEGGTIVLGVVEREGHAYADGLADASIAKYQKVIRDGANNRTIVNRDILSLSDVAVASVGFARLLVVHVPRAERTIRPVHEGQTPFGSTFKRDDEGDLSNRRKDAYRSPVLFISQNPSSQSMCQSSPKEVSAENPYLLSPTTS